MIERDFIAQKMKEYDIKKHIESRLNKVGISSIKLKKIPLGEKIIIETSRPSLIVGSKGANIKDLTKTLKREFKMENPQIEINEVKNIFLDANIVAERIASSLERFGSARFKGIGHKVMQNVTDAGALGVEIILSGKIPSARARNWRFYQGYLKKCGDIAIHGVRKAQTIALLKSGIIGIKVAIMPADLVLPDKVEILEESHQIIEEIVEDKKKTKKSAKKKKAPAKKSVTKKKDVTKDKEIQVIEEPEVEKSAEKTEVTEVVEENNPEKEAAESTVEDNKEETEEVKEEVTEEVKEAKEAKEVKEEVSNVVEEKEKSQ